MRGLDDLNLGAILASLVAGLLLAKLHFIGSWHRLGRWFGRRDSSFRGRWRGTMSETRMMSGHLDTQRTMERFDVTLDIQQMSKRLQGVARLRPMSREPERPDTRRPPPLQVPVRGYSTEFGAILSLNGSKGRGAVTPLAVCWYPTIPAGGMAG